MSLTDRLEDAFSWTQDETFVLVAAGQLLLALGAPRETVRPLPRLVAIVRRLDELESVAGAGRDAGADATEEQRRARAETTALIDELAEHAFPLAHVVLDGLARHRIRTEIAGISRTGLEGALADLEDLYASGRWRDADDQALRAYEEWIEERHRIEVEPVRARSGEVRRIVRVLRRMPRQTLRRITKVTSAPALTVLIGGGLLMMHREMTAAPPDPRSTGPRAEGSRAEGARAPGAARTAAATRSAADPSTAPAKRPPA
ncbi:hypothetical protein [Brachybacterium huguangmaarense]